MHRFGPLTTFGAERVNPNGYPSVKGAREGNIGNGLGLAQGMGGMTKQFHDGRRAAVIPRTLVCRVRVRRELEPYGQYPRSSGWTTHMSTESCRCSVGGYLGPHVQRATVLV